MKFKLGAQNWRIFKSHPARGGWIEILIPTSPMSLRLKSHPARGGWIEMYDSKLPTGT